MENQIAESHGVFVGDLSFFATEQDLLQLFAPFGPIDSVMIRRGKAGDTLHYGFVKMNDSAAQTAISTLQGCKFMGRRLRLNLLSVSNHCQSEKNTWAQIHVSFLAKSVRQQVNEEFLDSLFGQIGKVADCIVKQYRLEVNPHKQSGYGFVYFYDIECALNAIKLLKNKVIDGVQLDCNFSSEADAIKYASRLEEVFRGPPSVSREVMKGQATFDGQNTPSPNSVAMTSTPVISHHHYVPSSTQSSQPSFVVHTGPTSLPMQYSAPQNRLNVGVSLPPHIVIPQQQYGVVHQYPNSSMNHEGSPTAYLFSSQSPVAHSQGAAATHAPSHVFMMPHPNMVPMKYVQPASTSPMSMTSMTSASPSFTSAPSQPMYSTTFLY